MGKRGGKHGVNEVLHRSPHPVQLTKNTVGDSGWHSVSGGNRELETGGERKRVEVNANGQRRNIQGIKQKMKCGK
jgi:hypothetical protein